MLTVFLGGLWPRSRSLAKRSPNHHEHQTRRLFCKIYLKSKNLERHH